MQLCTTARIKKMVRQLVFFIGIGAVVYPWPVFGQTSEMNYDNIISDTELIAYQTMSSQDIQRFLEHKGSYLSNHFILLDTGERISAAEHIFRAAQTFHVNPKFLLVMLQKEQSLIEEASPTVNQLDWAMGYGCFDNAPCNERWRGFHKQVNSAAEQFRYYYEHIGEYPFQPGKTSIIDGVSVTPRNAVTAALYNYTPHLHGNQLFRDVWQRYFLQQLPDGTLVQVSGDPTVWLVQNGVKRAFTSWLAFVSRYDPKFIVSIARADLDQLSRGIDIDFAAYSIVQGNTSGNRYLLTVNEKRLISSDDVFKNLGFNPEEVEEANDAELAQIPDGRPVTLSDAYPTGTVLQDKTDGSLFYVESGRRYPITGKEIIKINYPALPVTRVTTEHIEKYKSGLPIRIKDGTLVKGSGPEVYVISNGQRRHIETETAFTSIGYKWANISTVSDDVLNLHPVGEPITVQ